MESDPATSVGPTSPAGSFATTHWSVVLAAGASESSTAAPALERLCRTYWPAVYVLTRRFGHNPDEARDLTQAFFARILERRWVAGADPEKGRFRGFLVTTVKRFLADNLDWERALKRGGGQTMVSFETVTEETWYGLEPRDDRSPDWLFDRRWALTLLGTALARLEDEQARAGSTDVFRALKEFLSGNAGEETLADIGARLGIGPSATKMRLLRLRERYRELLRAEVAETLADPAAVDEEMRCLAAALA
jgi:RNA polymerase sigma factor (sigma-70 family)